MAKKAVLHEQDYVVSDSTIWLSVAVGERQYGSSMVFLDEKMLANGEIDELEIGKGDKIEGSVLSIYTLVTDVRDNTDQMAVTWILAGGESRVVATAIGAAPKKFGSQMFKGVFHLKAP